MLIGLDTSNNPVMTPGKLPLKVLCLMQHLLQNVPFHLLVQPADNPVEQESIDDQPDAYRNEENKTESENPNGGPSQKVEDEDCHGRSKFADVEAVCA